MRPITGALSDRSPLVREAAAGALGHLDSTSAVPALIRVLHDDQVASVRRTAAWALGQLEAREAVSELAAALHGDKDPQVREMSAWALGNINGASLPRRCWRLHGATATSRCEKLPSGPSVSTTTTPPPRV